MESKCLAIGAYPLHICDRRQLDRTCRKKNYEPAPNRIRLALGNHLYPSCYDYLANDGAVGQRSFRTVPVFFRLYPETGRKNWSIENKKSQKSKLKSKKRS